MEKKIYSKPTLRKVETTPAGLIMASTTITHNDSGQGANSITVASYINGGDVDISFF